MQGPTRWLAKLRYRKRRVAAADPEFVVGLIRLACKLAGESDFGQRMESLCEEMRQLLFCDRCSIFLLEDGLYRARFNAGNPPDIAKRFPTHVVSPKDPLVQRALTTRRHVSVNDTSRSTLMNPQTAKIAQEGA